VLVHAGSVGKLSFIYTASLGSSLSIARFSRLDFFCRFAENIATSSLSTTGMSYFSSGLAVSGCVDTDVASIASILTGVSFGSTLSLRSFARFENGTSVDGCGFFSGKLSTSSSASVQGNFSAAGCIQFWTLDAFNFGHL
jgi:hypothetical protein